MLCNPATGRQLLRQGFVELSGTAIVDVLNGRSDMAQPSGPEPCLEAPGRTVGSLAINEQGEPFGMAHVAGRVLARQFDEGIGHAVELERLQLVDGWMVQHVSLLQWK